MNQLLLGASRTHGWAMSRAERTCFCIPNCPSSRPVCFNAFFEETVTKTTSDGRKDPKPDGENTCRRDMEIVGLNADEGWTGRYGDRKLPAEERT